MYWSRVSECVGRCVRVSFLIVGMCWSSFSEYVGSCARISILNRRNVLAACFGMCWQLCFDLFFESSECIGPVFRNVLVVVLGFVFLNRRNESVACF